MIHFSRRPFVDVVKTSFMCILCAMASGPSLALEIETIFVAEGETIPGVGRAESQSSNSSGGGDLQTIVEAAANAWEAVIQDDFRVRIHYGWFPTEPISVSAFHQGTAIRDDRQTAGSLAFNSDNTIFSFFLDRTPAFNEEFGAATEDRADLGGGEILVRREFAATASAARGSIDIYTSAVHELGHALGLAGWQFFQTEVADGDIDILDESLSDFAGTVIPMSGTHIDVHRPILSNRGRPLGTRSSITQVDLLAVCQLSGFEQCRVQAIDPPTCGDFDLDGDVDTSDRTILVQNWTGALVAGNADFSQGDCDGDGDVDSADNTSLVTNWTGAELAASLQSPRHATNAVIPEPSSELLATIGLLTSLRSILTRRKRKKSNMTRAAFRLRELSLSVIKK